MKKLYKIVTFTGLLLLIILDSVSIAQAESLPSGFLVGDDTGFQAGTDGEYFINHNDIHPGLTFKRQIALSNFSQEEGDLSLSLVMNPEDEEHVPKQSGAINLLKAVRVKLTYQGQVLYEGMIDGEGTPIANKKASPIQLGVLEVGEVRHIQTEFTVSEVNEEFPVEEWRNTSSIDFYWLFYASRKDTTLTSEPPVSSELPPISSDKSPVGKLPQTGEDWRNVLLGMTAGIFLLTVALIIVKKQHQKSNS